MRCFGRKVHGKLRLRGRIRSSSQSIKLIMIFSNIPQSLSGRLERNGPRRSTLLTVTMDLADLSRGACHQTPCLIRYYICTETVAKFLNFQIFVKESKAKMVIFCAWRLTGYRLLGTKPYSLVFRLTAVQGLVVSSNVTLPLT